MARALQPDEQRSFREHLGELRWRLVWWLVFFGLFSLIAFHFHLVLEKIVIRPIHTKLYYTSPAGGIDFLFKIVLGFGLIPSLPVLLYQLIKFLRPAVPAGVSKSLPKVIIPSVLLVIASTAFAYFIGLPIVFKFFDTFTNPDVQALITTNEYVSFVINYLVMFAVLFQLPLALILINKIFPINLKKLARYQPYIIIGFFLLAGIITPTFQPLSQLITTLPMILLFEGAIFWIWRQNRQKQRRAGLTELAARAAVDYQTGNYAAAETAYVELAWKDRHNPKWPAKIGVIYLKAGRYQEAANALAMAVKADPASASAWANLGRAELQLKNRRAARKAFKRALKLKPNDANYQQLYDLSRK